MLDRAWIDAFESDGFAIHPEPLDGDILSALARAVESLTGGGRDEGIHRREFLYGVRNLFGVVPETESAIREKPVRDAARAVLGPDTFCVRALYFRRSPRARVGAPFRQDVSIVVRERAEVTGFGPWMWKAGRQHVVAPPGTLSTIASLQIHLDGCDEAGALRVVPGSHQYGRLPEDSIESFTRYEVARCAVSKGGLLWMRPLLLRAPGARTESCPCRIIQLDFCARNLPPPLEWRERTGLD